MGKKSPEKTEYYFHAEGLSVGYDGKPIISEISFGIKRGEILVLIGPNGAGKTTMLRSIIKQLEPVAGTVFLDGRDMANIDPKTLSREMSVVLTERVKTELMSCGDVVETGRYPYTGKFGVLSEHDKEVAREAMELVNITELSERDFSKISDGQRQRVMLARALCQEPDIIVLDEPTSFLDIRYQVEFLSILKKLAREKNLTVITSLHDLDQAEKLADKVLCVGKGRIDRFGTADEVFNTEYISRFYGVSEEELRALGSWRRVKNG